MKGAFPDYNIKLLFNLLHLIHFFIWFQQYKTDLKLFYKTDLKLFVTNLKPLLLIPDTTFILKNLVHIIDN